MKKKKSSVPVYQPKFIQQHAPTMTPEIWNVCMRQLKKGEFVDEFVINPSMAQHILTSHNPKNRAVNKNHVASLTRDMVNGKWLGHVGDEMTVDRDGHLINSQHRLHAVINSGIPQRFTVRMGVDPEKRLVQDRGRIKSEADLMYMNDRNVSYRTSQASMARMMYSFVNDQRRPHSYVSNTKPTTSELKEMHDEFGSGMLESLLFLQKHNIRQLMVATNAAMLHYLFKSSDFGSRADEFFEGIATGVNLNRDDPRMVVRNRLLGDNKGAFRRQLNKDVSMGLIVKAWNAWIAGKKWSSKERTPDAMPKIDGLSKLGSHQLYDT